jgi:hypothetical protein
MDPSRLASLEHSIRLLKTWHLLLSVLLLVSLGANASWVQAAADPPIRVYTASPDDAGVGGSSSSTGVFVVTTDHTVSSPLVLLSITTSHLSRDHDHICAVTASAKVGHTGNPEPGIIAIGLSRGEDIRQISVTERSAGLVLTDDDDVFYEELTTTFAFTGVRRDETIRFSARWDFGAGDLAVTVPSMTVVCLRDSI